MPVTENISIFRYTRGLDRVNMAVVGCCGMGCNALRTVDFPEGVKTIALGTDRRDITGTGADIEMLVSPEDAMAVAKSGQSKIASSKTEIEIGYLLKDMDVVFTIAGLGGNSGGWVASLVAKTSKRSRATSLGLVTVPFAAEGRERKARSTKQLEALRKWTDAVVPLKNDLIMKEVPNLPMLKAFEVMNTVVATPVRKFSGLDRAGLRKARELFRHEHIFRLDAAQSRGDNAAFAIMEQLKSSPWLSLGVLDPRSAIMFIEDYKPDESVAVEFAEEFRRMVGHDVPMVISLHDTGTMTLDAGVCVMIGF